MDEALAAYVLAGVAVAIAVAYAIRDHRILTRVERLVDMHHDGPPTEEIPLPPTMGIGARAPEWNERMRIKKPPGAW